MRAHFVSIMFTAFLAVVAGGCWGDPIPEPPPSDVITRSPATVKPRDGSASPPPLESQSPPEVPAAGRDDSGDDGPAAAANRRHVPAPGIVVDDPGGSDTGLPAGIAPEDPAFKVLLEANRDTFIPTEAETRAGIDPNDAGTWPEGYRGPAIERMIQKQREAGGGPEPEVPPGFLPSNR